MDTFSAEVNALTSNEVVQAAALRLQLSVSMGDTDHSSLDSFLMTEMGENYVNKALEGRVAFSHRRAPAAAILSLWTS